MQAAVYRRYGAADVVQIVDIERPVPKDTEVLIEVRAASINSLDCGLLRGAGRIVTGLRRPKFTRLGVDVAGQVVAVGTNVTRFQRDDEVFGVCISDPYASAIRIWISQGAFAEYACVPEATLVLKPANTTWEQAAATPVVGFTALQGLRDKGRIQHGQKVLVNGASGGVGTFAVQIARWFGADVTGVCSTRNVEMVRSIGAHRVIDYTREQYVNLQQRYDLLFDCVGNHTLSACRRVLAPHGICVMVGELTGRGVIGSLSRVLCALAWSGVGSQKLVTFLATPNANDLALLHDLLNAGKLTPVVDRRYRLSEIPDAIRYLEARQARGKVVITM